MKKEQVLADSIFRIGRPWRLVIMYLLLVLAIFYFLFPMEAVDGECSRRAGCINNMKNIVLALKNYQIVYGTLPPAWTTDKEGNRLHSWRVLLLPFVESEFLYQKIRLSEPWDSEYNRQFHSQSLPFYYCPSSELKNGHCNYVVIVDKNGFFPGAKPYTPQKEDNDKILLMETPNSFCWMDPYADLGLEDTMIVVNDSIHGKGIHSDVKYHFGCIPGHVYNVVPVNTLDCNTILLNSENLHEYSDKWQVRQPKTIPESEKPK